MRQVSRKFSGVFDSTTPVVRTIVRFWIELQPVYCKSAITSHLLLICRKTDKFAVSGNSMSSLMSPLASALLTAPASAPATGASDAGSVGIAGLLILAEPLTLYLILERYDAPKRVCGSKLTRTPTFQPQPPSLPVILASDWAPV